MMYHTLLKDTSKELEKFLVVVAGVMLESDDSVSSLSEIENLPTVTTAYGRLFI